MDKIRTIIIEDEKISRVSLTNILQKENFEVFAAEDGEKGLEQLQKALSQFEKYQIKTALNPNWGKEEAEYFVTNKP